MGDNRPLFILAANGPYENRGCEAIVRGTVKILKEHFSDPRFICISHFQTKDQYNKQCQSEIDSSIIHLPSLIINKNIAIKNFWRPEIWTRVFQHFSKQIDKDFGAYSEMRSYLSNATAVLSIGGDNYSLDYGGTPSTYTVLDDIVLRHKKPIFIWGASVGPFSAIPEYERYMTEHLGKVTGIFARESATIDYLNSINVISNVHHVADPAFLMEPIKPKSIEGKMTFEKDGIGLNLSPLMARYITGGNLTQWINISASIIEKIAQNSEMHVYLIPHVTLFDSNDYLFMEKSLSRIHKKLDNVTLIPPIYNAEEIKWIISRMTLFAGARTHSTIAALSSCVPTLSFAYSIKARGINKDIFGHSDYCLNPTEMNVNTVSEKIKSMLNNRESLKSELTKQIPDIQRKASFAGRKLREIIDR